ncbi:MAG: Ni/Fe hydrogenase subunit alpha [Phycisphaerales bacterium]|nr:Ni/Fe hydrogenase subunit alpha [Phycisphaerales bacterium]
MSKTITIDGVTRIEGHARITIDLNDQGRVHDAKFHVTQFRGFEKFVEGRPLTEMPSVMARICGICPVSHLMASAKACDELLSVEIPPTAANLRRVMNLAQLVQSHALSFFHLSSPDLLYGFDADPATRNIFGLINTHPEFAKDGILLRKFGQEIIQILGGKKIHPAWVVPGGVSEPLTAERREKIIAGIPDALDRAKRAATWLYSTFEKFPNEEAAFANFPTMFAGLVTPQGNIEHYDGALRFADNTGKLVAEFTNPYQYRDYISEATENFSFLKSPFFKSKGYPDGIYRVGPLARVILAEKCGTPLADAELKRFREKLGRAPASSFHYHWARLIEILHAIEKIGELMNDPDILSPRVRARARPNRNEGVGISEAPRGTLIHHYKIDDQGQMRWANMIIATGNNNLAMNRGVKQVAERFVNGDKLTEGMLNRVEAVIRCFDPCLSCSTHALGQMPMIVELRGPNGELLDEIRRD